ncbi:MAG: cobalamin biosynthesis protein [Sulfolobales archaeon]
MNYSPFELIMILLLAHIMDIIYPYHKGILLKVHPVHTSYVMAVRLGKKFSSRIRGVVVWILTISLHMIVYAIIIYASLLIHRSLLILISAYILKTSFSIRLLLNIVRNVAYYLRMGDLHTARFWVQQIVRRDTQNLREHHLASAAIESLAESLVDGYLSPLFYFLLLGPLGALFQRLTNTLDSALGYKEPRYKDVGWFSARADTVVNYIPARLTGFLIALTSPVAGGSILTAIKTMRQECRKTESVNAGYPISSMAGALGVVLEKVGHYTINNNAREACWADILRACRIAKFFVMLWIIISLTILTIFDIIFLY